MRGLRLVAAVALCTAVAVLAATGTFSGARHRAPHDSALAARARAMRRVNAQVARVEARLEVLIKPRTDGECARQKPMTGRLPRERYRRAVRIAEKYLGVKYSWGGASPSGFDSSGLVMYVFGKLGVQLPHYSVAQYCYAHAVHIPKAKLEPGDLVFFDDRGHVGIYVGKNRFIHEPHTGASVEIDRLAGPYASSYYGATRILG